jgi:serine/threonine-protein kinase
MSTKSQAACPNCRQVYSVAESMAGRTLRCSKCGSTFVLGAKPAGAPPPQTVEGVDGGRTNWSTIGPDVAARSTAGTGGPRPTAPTPRAAGTGDVPKTIGPYQIRRRLGQGAFGVVYLAYHPFLDIEVAVKMLRAEALASAQSVERFLREAKLLARMDHPNVLRVYDAGKHGEDYYIASAYIAGKDLAAVLPEEGGLEPRRAVRLTLQMLRALGYAHDLGIVHRDVKPANARLTDQDTLFLMDFGLAGLAAQEATPESGEDPMRLTRSGAIMGTPAYMAPEQAGGMTGQAGPAADLYSAGVVLYELLTGRLPFEGANLAALLYVVVHSPPPPPSEFHPGLDPQLEAICLKALAKRPEERFQSAAEFAAALEAWACGQPTELATAVPVADRPAAPARVKQPAKVRATTAARPASATQEAVPVAQATLRAPAAPAPAVSARRGALWGCLIAGGAGVFLLVVLVIGVVAYVAHTGGGGPTATHRGFFEDRDKYQH